MMHTVDNFADADTAYHCQRLLNLYAHAQDTSDADLFVALFAEDARWERPVKDEAVIGLAAIRRDIEALMASRPATARYQHIITNVLCRSLGTAQAETSCYSLVFHGDVGRTDALPPIGLPGGILRYFTRFARQDGIWRITFHRAEKHFSPAH
jgi:hypothetical protein